MKAVFLKRINICIVAIVVCVIVAVCFLTNRRQAAKGLADGEYISSECLYMTLFSSNMPVLGERYRVESDAFVFCENDGRTQKRIPIEHWEWQPFPYTDEEWSLMVGFDVEENPIKEDISTKYKEMLYQPLSENYFLLQMDDELWLVRTYTEPDAQERIWSAYVITVDK